MRYFIIFYDLYCNGDSQIYKLIARYRLTHYPNESEITKDLNGKDMAARITNIIELSEADYKDFIK